MLRVSIAIVLLSAASAAQAASPTDFGVREFGKAWDKPAAPEPTPAVIRQGGAATRVDLTAIARIGGQWGRVTSTRRTPAHNRYVGGVANSYHLSGQAIDIARRPGVRHGQIVAAYREAGYAMIEALDEGDHTHLAFGSRHRSGPRPQMVITQEGGQTQWRIMYAPSR